jgi:hypothetical protein
VLVVAPHQGPALGKKKINEDAKREAAKKR